jgi:hypothetical protein
MVLLLSKAISAKVNGRPMMLSGELKRHLQAMLGPRGLVHRLDHAGDVHGGGHQADDLARLVAPGSQDRAPPKRPAPLARRPVAFDLDELAGQGLLEGFPEGPEIAGRDLVEGLSKHLLRTHLGLHGLLEPDAAGVQQAHLAVDDDDRQRRGLHQGVQPAAGLVQGPLAFSQLLSRLSPRAFVGDHVGQMAEVRQQSLVARTGLESHHREGAEHLAARQAHGRGREEANAALRLHEGMSRRRLIGAQVLDPGRLARDDHARAGRVVRMIAGVGADAADDAVSVDHHHGAEAAAEQALGQGRRAVEDRLGPRHAERQRSLDPILGTRVRRRH